MGAAQRARTAVLEHTPLRDRATRKRLVHARRRAFEAAGSRRYSRPGFDDIDRKLQRFLPRTGVFVEAGANDGYTWSNTYYLERWHGWKGVLVEGIPELAAECRALRTASQVVSCALVAPDHPTPTVSMTYSDLSSLIAGSEPTLEAGLAARPGTSYAVEVPARTLSDVLEHAGVGRPDFMSLDLEGHEASALRGLDLPRHGPDWLLVEVIAGEGRAGIESVLADAYVAQTDLTAGDVLYRRVTV